jgi:hypothetical protein
MYNQDGYMSVAIMRRPDRTNFAARRSSQRDHAGESTRGRGAQFFLIDEFAHSALGLTAAPYRWPAHTHVRGALNHLVYGGGLVWGGLHSPRSGS